MRTEAEIKQTLKSLKSLDKLEALTNEEKHGVKMLEWVLGKQFIYISQIKLWLKN